MSWMVYDLLPIGTVLRATDVLRSVTRCWSTYTAFDHKVHKKPAVDDLHDLVVFPGFEEGDTMMFLGMTEEKYPHVYYEFTNHRARRGGRLTGTPKRSIVNHGDRHFPTWLIGEKVFIWSPCMSTFGILKLGSGEKAATAKYDDDNG